MAEYRITDRPWSEPATDTLLFRWARRLSPYPILNIACGQGIEAAGPLPEQVSDLLRKNSPPADGRHGARIPGTAGPAAGCGGGLRENHGVCQEDYRILADCSQKIRHRAVGFLFG